MAGLLLTTQVKTKVKPWHYTGERTNLRLDDIIIGVDEVIKLSKEIDITKSSAIENVSSRIVKDAFLAIPGKVCQLFNASTAQGVDMFVLWGSWLW